MKQFLTLSINRLWNNRPFDFIFNATIVPAVGLLAALIYMAVVNRAEAQTNPVPKLPATRAVGPQTKLSDLRLLPENAMVQTPSGREIPAKHYVKLADVMAKIRQNGITPRPNPKFIFSRTQGAPQVQLKPGVNLKEVAKRPDTDVLQLPDGRKLTVGDLKKIAVLHQKQTGKSLMDINPSANSPSRQGNAIKVTSNADIKKLSSQPDSTILETPKGKRITLGELRAYAKANNKAFGERK